MITVDKWGGGDDKIASTFPIFLPLPLFRVINSGGRAIGPGGAAVSGASRGGADVTIDGQRGQYTMSQGGQRISSGKSSVLNGVQVGKEASAVRRWVMRAALQRCTTL